MFNTVLCQARARAKAIAAFVVGGAASFAATRGFSLDPFYAALITATLAGAIVHQIPNRVCSNEPQPVPSAGNPPVGEPSFAA